MIEFRVVKQSKKSRARLGILKTPHGEVETPSLVPVATLAAVKAMRSDEVAATKTQILISNTYHLHLLPGEHVVKKAGGINTFMQWDRPTMTDSGGFQVFSLGFGRDFGVGKVEKFYPGKLERAIDRGDQPASLKIMEHGVKFKSPLTGEELFLGPRESIKIQEALGADIMYAFDECTPSGATRAYVASSLDRTNRWARESLAARRSKQALYGIVQGSTFRDLREASATFIAGLDFDGYGIGGDLGESKAGTKNTLDWTIPHLDPAKPRHLLGIGYIEDMELIIKGGADTFDCTVPTHFARRGIAFTSQGKLDMGKANFLKDQSPLDKKCECITCGTYTRAYISHLVRAKEITSATLITYHNLFYFNSYVEKLREKIKKGLL
ncbi:MAG TPA: tRNA guanosine(34) transglycosylase Tgt [Candidatus Paceibacterota bacterium]|nr:tRNA guanosine(34) transglycosylase Tgt [Candidatus Paceibacterota bacterium]